MGKIVISCIEGFSASVRDDDQTVSKPFSQVMDTYRDRAEMVFREYHSSSAGTVKEVSEWIQSHDPQAVSGVYMVGKSLGGVESFWAYRKIQDRLEGYRRVSLVFVDAHSPFPTLYGTLFTKMKIRHNPANTRILNIYQREKWPKGVFVTNADKNIRLGKGADHYNIISCDAAKQLYAEGFDWILDQ